MSLVIVLAGLGLFWFIVDRVFDLGFGASDKDKNLHQ